MPKGEELSDEEIKALIETGDAPPEDLVENAQFVVKLARELDEGP